MEEKRKIVYALVCVGLILVLFFSLFCKLNNLEEKLITENNNLKNEIASLEDRISLIHSQTEQKLNEHTSLFSKVDFEFFEFDQTKNLVFLRLNLVLKAVTKDTALKVSCNGKSAQFERVGQNEFSAVVPVSLFIKENECYPLVEISSLGKTQTQYLKEIPLTNLCTRYLPSLMIRLLSGFFLRKLFCMALRSISSVEAYR